MSYHLGHPPRLPGWDYGWPGAYFVTITVADRSAVFRRQDGSLSTPGEIVDARWSALGGRFVGVIPDDFVAMPDHVHGIVWIGMVEDGDKGALMNQGPTSGQFPAMGDDRVTLGKVVRSWKAECTHAIRRAGTPAFRWQSRYYETVIRNDRMLAQIRRYIRDNPLRP